MSGGLFGYLHQQFLFGYQSLFEWSLTGHIVSMKEAHLVFAQVDESSVNSWQDVFDTTCIDVSQQQFPSVYEKLRYPIVLQQSSYAVLLGYN
jgi:hypothetical protein